MDGRKTQVVLLDERKIELVVQSRMITQDLLHIVCNYFSLTEKAYFGLSFQDDSGHYFFLQNDCKVLDHEYPAKHRTGVLILYFLVKLYPEHLSQLQDSVTYELFFLQTRSLIFRGFVNVDGSVAYKLAALALQASYGDFYDDDLTKENLKKLPVLPRSVFREHPTLSYSEERVIAEHKQLIGRLRGYCIVEYLQISQTLPTYGVHFYQVKDNKTNAQAILGLSAAGVSQYAVSNLDAGGKKERVRFFGWKQLENLYYREKKFSIEVRDPRRIMQTLSSFNLQDESAAAALDRNEHCGAVVGSANGGEEHDDVLLTDAITDPTTQVSLSRRTYGPTSVTVHSWFTNHPLLTKNLWQMAIIQHQFFLESKHRRQILSQHQHGSISGNIVVQQDLAVIAQRLNTMQGVGSSLSDRQPLQPATKQHSRLSHSSFFRSHSNLKPSTSHTSLNTSINSNPSIASLQQQQLQPQMINRSFSTTTRRRSAVLESELTKQQQHHLLNVDTISVNSSPLMLHRHLHHNVSTFSAKDQLDGSSNHDSSLTTGVGAPFVTELNSSHSTGHDAPDGGSFRNRIEILRTRRMALDDAINAKLVALKALCVREAELTGVLPFDTPLEPNEPLPSFKKRIGTAFNLSGKKLERFMSSTSVVAGQNKAGVDTVDCTNATFSSADAVAQRLADADDDAKEKQLAELELRQELQRQILHAVKVLADDTSVTSKKIRKQRKQIFVTEQQKLADIDKQLNELKNGGAAGGQSANGVVWKNQLPSTSSQQPTASGRVAGRRLFSQLRQQQQQPINTRNAQPLIVSRYVAGSSSITTTSSKTHAAIALTSVTSTDLESAKPASKSFSILRQNSLQITTSTTASIHPALGSSLSYRPALPTSTKTAAALVEPDVQSIGCASSVADSSSSDPSSIVSGSMQSLSAMPNNSQRSTVDSGSMLRNSLLTRRASKLSVESSGTNSLLMPPPPPPPPPPLPNSVNSSVIASKPDEAAFLLRKSQSQGALHTIADAPKPSDSSKPRFAKQHSTQTLPTAQAAATLADLSVSGNITTGGGSVGRGCAENDSGFVGEASCCSGNNPPQSHRHDDYDEINGETEPDAAEPDEQSNNRHHVYNVQHSRHQQHIRQLSKVSEITVDVEQQPSAHNTRDNKKSVSSRHPQGIYDEVEELNRSKYDNVNDVEVVADDADDEPGVFVRSGAARPDGELYEQTRASMRVLSSSSATSTSTVVPSPDSVAATASETTRATPMNVTTDESSAFDEVPESSSLVRKPTAAASSVESKTAATAPDDRARRQLHLFNSSSNMPSLLSSSSRMANPALSASAHKRRPLAFRSDAVSLLDADTAASILNAVGMTASPTRQQSSSVVISDTSTIKRTVPSVDKNDQQHQFAVPQMPKASSRGLKSTANVVPQEQQHFVERAAAVSSYRPRLPSAAQVSTGGSSSESRWYYNESFQQQQQQHQQPSNTNRQYQFGMPSAAGYQLRAAGLPPRATYQFGEQSNRNSSWRASAPPLQPRMQYAYGESRLPATAAGVELHKPASGKFSAGQQSSPIGYPQRRLVSQSQQPVHKAASGTTPFSPLPPQPLHHRTAVTAPVATNGAAAKTIENRDPMPPPPSPTRREPVRFPSGTTSSKPESRCATTPTPVNSETTIPPSSPQPPPLPSKRERCRSNSSTKNTLIRAVGSSGVLPAASSSRVVGKQQDNSRTTRSGWNNAGDALVNVGSDDKYVRQALV